MTQNNLGIAYADLPTGDRGENLTKAIACYEAALRVYTERDFPADWAMTQNNLGNRLQRSANGRSRREPSEGDRLLRGGAAGLDRARLPGGLGDDAEQPRSRLREICRRAIEART